MSVSETMRSAGGAGVKLSDERAWAATAERDRRFDGSFVYAVATTGIYCRPSCPSRRPKRENVGFFETVEEAEAAGYRPCRRCRPDRPGGTPTERAIERAREHLARHRDETVTLAALAEVAGLSPHHLQRTFKRIVGSTPREYQASLRLEAFKREARSSNVLDATFAAGYGSSRALYEQAGRGLGMTPGAYRRGGRGVAIRYTVENSRFGLVLVAATDRGVCAVLLGDEETALVAELEEEFPGASEIGRDDAGLSDWTAPIVAYLDGVHAHPSVSVELEGTDFQRRVWRALQQIPYGETRSYGEIAERMGRPGAARAVAGACARNRVALVVPCHRAVRGDGAPGGFRWGSGRKRELLRLEGGGETGSRD